jgi:16S rRNA (uracil1498-N3)-methyltransferase
LAVPVGGGPLVFVDDLDAPLLAEDDLHHLARVRRVRDGHDLVLADGRGRWRPARMAGATPEPVGPHRSAPRPDPELGVAFALVKGQKPELVVQKLTELGVDRIVAFTAARSVVRWDAARSASAHQRLVRVAREAAMQSRRARLPTIEPVAAFPEVVTRPGVCLADMGGGPLTLARPLVLVGPEGGWTDDERAAGVPVVGLADGVLRAETAAIVAGGLLAALRAALVAPGRRSGGDG